MSVDATQAVVDKAVEQEAIVDNSAPDIPTAESEEISSPSADTGVEQQDREVDQATDAASKPVAPPTHEEYQTLLNEREQMLDEIAQMRPYLEAMQRDPEILRRVTTGRASTEETVDPLDTLEDSIRQDFAEGPASALIKTLKPLIQEVKESRAFRATAGRDINGMVQTFAATEYERGLAKRGLDEKTLRSKDFQLHQRELRRNPNFRNDEARRGDYAAELAAATWKAKGVTRTSYQKTRTTVEQAKNGNLNGGTTRGAAAAGAGKIVELSLRDPDRFNKAQAYRMKYPDVRIVYKPETQE